MFSRDFSSSTEQYRWFSATVVTVHVPACASAAVPVPSHRYVQMPVTVQATVAVYVPVLTCVVLGVLVAPVGSVTVRATVDGSVGVPFTLKMFCSVANSLASE